MIESLIYSLIFALLVVAGIGYLAYFATHVGR